MRIILSISIIGLFSVSCKTNEKLTYIDQNGECYPTLEYIQKMTNMSAENGVRYYWFQCDWYTWEQRDSLSAIENDRIMDKLIQSYTTDHHPVTNHQ